ncbi:beta-lactamase/transpeptidase-like protein [Bisporella sp. PMI_857]|nr:beta-lactamase/transpeptidase-like protein [Bisporella sp. PMI_857]
MEIFERNLTQATSPDAQEILGVIATVVDRTGATLYYQASGHQSFEPGAPTIDRNSTFTLGSAGKFITHIAALQCVEQGLIKLDEPVYTHLPELDNLEVLSRNNGPDASAKSFIVRTPEKQITLRHLLSHSSGIDHESNRLIQEWRRSKGEEPRPDYHPTSRYDTVSQPNTEDYTIPLLFEPGEGWIYGASVEWTACLISRLTKQAFIHYAREHIFEPLSLKSTTYDPQSHPDLASRILKMALRNEDKLLPAKYPLRELITSIPDLSALLADLLSPSSRILSKGNVDLLFEPAFAPTSAARTAIQKDTENYAAPAGIPATMAVAPVNHSLAALFVEQELPLSGMPPGTVTWNGMPNLIWAMHRGKGIALIFATQLLPVDDEKTVDLAMTFFRSAWKAFG